MNNNDHVWIDPREQLPENKEQVVIALPAIYQDGKWIVVMDVYSWMRDYRVEPCNCYEDGHCNGTKERESCNCGGQTAVCDFYPEKAHFIM